MSFAEVKKISLLYKTIVYLDHAVDIAANLKIDAHAADHGIFSFAFFFAVLI